MSKEYQIQDTTIPKGFKWDGATIPRWLTLIGLILVICGAWLHLLPLILIGSFVCLIPVLFPRNGKYFKAALLHDYLLDDGTNRSVADYNFKQELKNLNIAKWRIFIMYAGVRIYSITKRRSK